MGVTCSAEYDDGSSATNVIVKNYKNSDSLAVSIGSGKWDQFGNLAPPEFELFIKDESNRKKNSYKTHYVNYGSKQHCSALGTLYSTTDGVADNEAVNDLYWQMKESSPLKIYSGWRVYENANDSDSLYQNDIDMYEYTLWDFGIEKPIPEEDKNKPESEKETCQGDDCEDIKTQKDKRKILGLAHIYWVLIILFLALVTFIIVSIYYCRKNRDERKPIQPHEKFGADLKPKRPTVRRKFSAA